MALARVDFFDLRYDHRHKSPVIFLKDAENEKYLPVWIGELEASSIESAVIHKVPQRPLTHDLFVSVLSELGAKVERVVIDRLESRTYYATLFLEHGDGTMEVDCRPSDAVALALRSDASIFVAEELMYNIKFVELREGGEESAIEFESAPGPETQQEEFASFQDFLKNITPTDFKEN